MNAVKHTPYRLRRTIVWLRRWRRTRGFGVQSPTDYHFVRYVINEHYRYYAYDTLKEQLPDIDRKTRKVCKLCFRIANWRQPESVSLIDITSTAYEKYIQAGCNTARITSLKATDTIDSKDDMLALTLNDNTLPLINETLQHAHNGTVIIINGIHNGRQNRKRWKQIRRNERATLTFDVYYCGIIIINDTRNAHHYIINY